MPIEDLIFQNSDELGRVFGNNPYSSLQSYIGISKSPAQDIESLFTNSQINNRDTISAQANKVADKGFQYYYPEEISNPLSNANFSETPPNIMKLTVTDVEGGELITELIKNTNQVAEDLTNNLSNSVGLVWSGDSTDPITKAGSILNSFNIDTTSLKKTTSNITSYLSKTESTKAVPLNLKKDPYGIIYLYAPNEVETNYGFQYTSTDLTPTYRALDILSGALQDDNKKAIDAIVQSGIGGIANVVSGILNKASPLLDGNVDIKSAIQAKTRLVPIENLEYLFNRTNRRQFKYLFKFYPKTKNEIKMIYQIISALKYYSHPEILNENTRYLKSPGVFRLQFYSLAKDQSGSYSYKENLFINKIKPCSLTDISVNYTDVGRFSTLKPLDLESFATGVFKSPVGISLSLVFEELQILTRNDFINPEEAFKNPDEGKYH